MSFPLQLPNLLNKKKKLTSGLRNHSEITRKVLDQKYLKQHMNVTLLCELI